MPHDAITRVGNLGRHQHMPKTPTFADRFGFEIPDLDDDVDDDHDSAYDPADDDDANDDDDDDNSTASHTSSDSSHSGSSAPDDDDRGDNIAQPLPGLSAGVDNIHDDDSAGDADNDDDDDNGNADDDDDDDDNNSDENGGDRGDNEDRADDERADDSDDDDNRIPEINIPDTVISTSPATPSRSTEVGGENTGVVDEIQNTHARNAGVGSGDVLEEPDINEEDDRVVQTMDERYGTRQHDINLRDRKPRSYSHLYDSDHLLTTFEEPMGELL
jgi:hypothetical protein